MRSIIMWAVMLLSIAPARAQTTVPISGIGTSIALDPANSQYVAIDTHVDSVTYTGPRAVVFSAANGRTVDALEVSGTIAGVGWGGTGIVARARNAHYAYNLPFVARWRADGRSHAFVMGAHGGSPSIFALVGSEKTNGAANAYRHSERDLDPTLGLPALLNSAAYVSYNRRGLGSDGTFSATYLPSEVAPLTASEVATLLAHLSSVPGPASFAQPGLTAGAPVPLTLWGDAATGRDVARALQEIVAALSGGDFQASIGFGVSAGSSLMDALEIGRSPINGVSVRTGGDFVVPYDSSSPRIFDAFILNGYVYATTADAAFPMAAPAIILQGLADQRAAFPVMFGAELLNRGLSLDGLLWIYEVRGLTHVTWDDHGGIGQGDRLATMVSAAIGNLLALLGTDDSQGSGPPPSRLGGRVANGALVFDQVGGGTTQLMPVVDDPSIDVLLPEPQITPGTTTPADATNWLAVSAALPHEGPITPPTIACRVGGYRIKFFGSLLLPFTPAQLAESYGDFGGYRDCVGAAIDGLAGDGLYDPRVESARDFAARSAGLFSGVPPSEDSGPDQADQDWSDEGD